jgi:hypothetical protein
MGETGTVVGVYEQKSNQWMVGGAMMSLLMIQVKLDRDDAVVDYRVDELRKVD